MPVFVQAKTLSCKGLHKSNQLLYSEESSRGASLEPGARIGVCQPLRLTVSRYLPYKEDATMKLPKYVGNGLIGATAAVFAGGSYILPDHDKSGPVLTAAVEFVAPKP